MSQLIHLYTDLTASATLTVSNNTITISNPTKAIIKHISYNGTTNAAANLGVYSITSTLTNNNVVGIFTPQATVSLGVNQYLVSANISAEIVIPLPNGTSNNVSFTVKNQITNGTMVGQLSLLVEFCV